MIRQVGCSPPLEIARDERHRLFRVSAGWFGSSAHGRQAHLDVDLPEVGQRASLTVNPEKYPAVDERSP
jgi:hypothetical protein